EETGRAAPVPPPPHPPRSGHRGENPSEGRLPPHSSPGDHRDHRQARIGTLGNPQPEAGGTFHPPPRASKGRDGALRPDHRQRGSDGCPGSVGGGRSAVEGGLSSTPQAASQSQLPPHGCLSSWSTGLGGGSPADKTGDTSLRQAADDVVPERRRDHMVRRNGQRPGKDSGNYVRAHATAA